MARLVKKYTNYGTLDAEYFVVPDSTGKDIIEGEYKEYSDDGEISKTVNYSNGKKNGKEIEYHAGGTIYSTCYFVDGYQEGNYLAYIDGKVYKNCYYKNNKLHGEYLEYHMESDVLYKQCFYINGQLDGIYKEYNVNGNIKNIKNSYDNGKINGFDKDYNNDGKLKRVSCYKNSIRVFLLELDDKDKDKEIDEHLMNALNVFYYKITK